MTKAAWLFMVAILGWCGWERRKQAEGYYPYERRRKTLRRAYKTLDDAIDRFSKTMERK